MAKKEKLTQPTATAIAVETVLGCVIYLSGKITGLPLDAVIEKFKWHAGFLEMKGYTVINPLEINKPLNKTWKEYIVNDIKHLLDCDAIYLLKDWGQSKGARIEYQIAKELGLKILFEGEFNAA